MMNKPATILYRMATIVSCIAIFSDLSSKGSAYVHFPVSQRSCCHRSESYSPMGRHSVEDLSFRTSSCRQSLKPKVRSQYTLMQSRDPNESIRNPLISNPILRTLSSPVRKIWSRVQPVLRYKWTIVLLLILLARKLIKQVPLSSVPKAALLGLLGTILVDLNTEMMIPQIGRGQGGGDNNNKDWTPLAQSKLRLFWKVPVHGKRADSSKNSIHKRDPLSKSRLKQKMQLLLFGCKKMLRYMIEKTTVYVLECENGKYYVGSTIHLKRRMQQHFQNSRSGSVWTKKHKPIRVVKMYRRVPYRFKLGFESQVTAELMWEKGINNVRGAMYLFSRDYTDKDMDSLVSFLGHYNDLSYTYVRSQLFKELTPVYNARKRRKEKRKKLQKVYTQIQNSPNQKEVKNGEEDVADLWDAISSSKQANDLLGGSIINKQTDQNRATKDLTLTNEIVSSPQNKKQKKRFKRSRPKNINLEKGNDDDDDDTADTEIDYQAMDAWLNRKINDEPSSSSSETDEPKTIEDL